jgi:hypothetical protein
MYRENIADCSSQIAEDGIPSLKNWVARHYSSHHHGLLGAPGGLYEGDEGGYVCGAMNAGENAKLVVVVRRGGQVTQLPVSAGGATCWFIDGYDRRNCDEGGKECHEN